MIFGTYHGKQIAILKGRYHYYEGISAQEVVFPYFVLNKMFRTWGADAIGMSTVLEIIACNFLQIKVLTFCCIANPAADRHEGKLSLAASPRLSSLRHSR